MEKRIKYIGLDVHKKTISISIADGECQGEVYYYGTISNDMNQLEKIIRKLVSQNNELKFVYEAGPCGYHIYRYLTQNPKRTPGNELPGYLCRSCRDWGKRLPQNLLYPENFHMKSFFF